MVREPRVLSLTDLREGETGFIRSIEGDDPLIRRLLDLGFIPGTRIEALRKAPMGGPTTFSLRGYCIGLRHSEAGRISIVPGPALNSPFPVSSVPQCGEDTNNSTSRQEFP